MMKFSNIVEDTGAGEEIWPIEQAKAFKPVAFMHEPDTLFKINPTGEELAVLSE